VPCAERVLDDDGVVGRAESWKHSTQPSPVDTAGFGQAPTGVPAPAGAIHVEGLQAATGPARHRPPRPFHRPWPPTQGSRLHLWTARGSVPICGQNPYRNAVVPTPPPQRSAESSTSGISCSARGTTAECRVRASTTLRPVDVQ
jgi:hypothetical protein